MPETSTVEPHSPAARGGVLLEHVGLETTGGTLTPLLLAGDSIPGEVTETFSTSHNGQTSILLRLYRGLSESIASAHFLGAFRIGGVPAEPAGSRVMLVTLSVTPAGDIRIGARDASDGSPLAVFREETKGWLGRLLARAVGERR